MTLISKNMFIDKLDDIANKCNNIYHSTIKMKRDDYKRLRSKLVHRSFGDYKS